MSEQEHIPDYQDSSAPPEPPAGYVGQGTTGVDRADNQPEGFDSGGEDAGNVPDKNTDISPNDFAEEDPWVDADHARYAGVERHADIDGYEPNRRNPEAAYGITTKMKVGWIALGFFLGIFSLIVMFVLTQNRDAIERAIAMRYVLVGLALGIIAELFFLSMLGALDLASAPISTSESSSWTSTSF